MAFWNLFLSSVLLPLVAIVLLWRKPRKPLAPWVTTALMAAALAGFSFFVAPWGSFGLGVRWLIAALFAGGLLFSAVRRPPADVREESGMRMFVKVLIAFFFGGVAVGAIRGHAVPAGAVDVEFPLRGGTFLVLHGGSTPPSNAHAVEEKQKYAVDLVKLGPTFLRARGVAPADPADYYAFGAPVMSPCDGLVASVADGQPDGAPVPVAGGPAPDPLGNQVVVACSSGITVHLAHLRRGSIAVRPGAAVLQGTKLAATGHSGASPEPHLHVHAEQGGHAIPLTFDGEWLVRNETIRR